MPQSATYLDQHDAFGSPIDYALSWMPKNMKLSNLNPHSKVNQIFFPTNKIKYFQK